MIIYPPFIADTIPAFTTTEVKIPFVMNPAVSFNEIKKFSLQIKDYVDSKLVETITVQKIIDQNIFYDENTNSGEVIFDNLKIGVVAAGQYYKFQLAFGDDDGFYAYSTASLGRCIGDNLPALTIKGRQNQKLSPTAINIGSSSYTGVYEVSGISQSEAVYEYRFYLQHVDSNKIIQDTGWLLHNVDSDIIDNEKRISQHSFNIKYELNQWEQYKIGYQIKTINGFETEMVCLVVRQEELPIIFEGQVLVTQDAMAKDNGYVQINIKGNPVKGSFELQRTSDNYEWNTLTTFETTKLSDMSIFSWKDWSVEQGIIYTYAIRQVSQDRYSERLKSAPIQIEFDHLFLSDGKRQLKIAFNPKISSFKDIILESKMDTIGSKYPFFFRNQAVRYKEIPISGLISYLADDNELFLTNDEMGLASTVSTLDLANNQEIVNIIRPRTTNLESYNFEAERKFKLAVMDWLNNGEPKLFRSPAEGNYIVRVMNTSLSPNEQLGRMLHTFSSTAYEIMDHTVENLQLYNILQLEKVADAPPKEVITTYIFKPEDFTKATQIDLVNLINTDKNSQKITPKTITNIQWHLNRPDKDEYITIDGKNYYNNITGLFQTPFGINYNTLTIYEPKNKLNYNSSITITYLPDLSGDYGEDVFNTMATTSKDVLFTIPAGKIVSETIDSNNIYKTYTLIVKRDEYYIPKEDEISPFALIFTGAINQEIDCSDGQIRYYNDISSDVKYEKGRGLNLDIYACVKQEQGG